MSGDAEKGTFVAGCNDESWAEDAHNELSNSDGTTTRVVLVSDKKSDTDAQGLAALAYKPRKIFATASMLGCHLVAASFFVVSRGVTDGVVLCLNAVASGSSQ